MGSSRKIEGFIKAEILHEHALFSDKLVPESIHILGIPYEGTACYRKGTHRGPDEIRMASLQLERFSPYLEHELSEFPKFYDLGNIRGQCQNPSQSSWLEMMTTFFSMCENVDLAQEKIRFIVLGGEHSISYAPLVTALRTYEDLLMVHLDAHADLREEYEGYPHSHACVIRRVVEKFSMGHQLLQAGIRSGTKEEFLWMKKHNTLVSTQAALLEKLDKLSEGRPIYLTLDVDYFDPAYVGGTGTPEAGGETFASFVDIVRVLSRKNFIGADIVELSPPIDTTGNSTVFVAKVVRELSMALALALMKNRVIDSGDKYYG